MATEASPGTRLAIYCRDALKRERLLVTHRPATRRPGESWHAATLDVFAKAGHLPHQSSRSLCVSCATLLHDSRAAIRLRVVADAIGDARRCEPGGLLA